MAGQRLSVMAGSSSLTTCGEIRAHRRLVSIQADVVYPSLSLAGTMEVALPALNPAARPVAHAQAKL